MWDSAWLRCMATVLLRRRHYHNQLGPETGFRFRFGFGFGFGLETSPLPQTTDHRPLPQTTAVEMNAHGLRLIDYHAWTMIERLTRMGND